MDNNENKFNFSEDEEQKKQEKIIEETKEKVAQDAKGLFDSVSSFLSEIFGFRQDTDRDATIEAIKADIPFKGATAWILICSIMVASVGLNANSTAVVIMPLGRSLPNPSPLLTGRHKHLDQFVASG